MNNFESKSNIVDANLKQSPTILEQVEIQQDYDYFRAQEVAEMLYNTGLISSSEFNKLTQLNRETFSPMLVEIMPKIT